MSRLVVGRITFRREAAAAEPRGGLVRRLVARNVRAARRAHRAAGHRVVGSRAYRRDARGRFA